MDGNLPESANPRQLPRRVKRIFILRPDHLGDLVLFSGSLRHIRNRWPEAEITLCVREYGLDLFELCPLIDRLVNYSEISAESWKQGRLGWMPAVRGCDRLGNWLRRNFQSWVKKRFACELAILPLLAPTPEYHRLMAWVPAKIRVGICGNHTNQTEAEDMKWRGCYSSQMDATEIPWNFPELETTRKFLEFLGIPVSADEMVPEFWTTAEDSKAAGNLMPAADEKMTIGIAPGVSSLPGKKLPVDWFIKVFETAALHNAILVFFGSDADRLYCESILESLATAGWDKGNLLNLCGKTSVRETVECYKKCDILLTQETAAVHMATALGKPVIGIVGGGHFGRFYPWGNPERSRVLHKPMDCYGCNWICKYETVRCIQEVDTQYAAQELNFLAKRLSRL